MSDLLITGGRVLDPAQGIDKCADVLILDGKVAGIDTSEKIQGLIGERNVEQIDATGKLVTPGLIDIHVHFREPGMEEKETIASGSEAAVAGGFTTVCCMPNTSPALDSEAMMNFVKRESNKADLAEVLAVGAITTGRAGEQLAEMGNMARGGAVAFSDDGCAVANAGVLRQAMLYAKMLDLPLMEHCEEPSLTEGGVMNEGYVSTSLGLPGIPTEAEEIIVARDILLAKLTGARLHLQHISTGGSIKIIKRAKEEGIRVTAEVCPHHLTLDEENLRSFDPVYKVAPPLRSRADVDACIEALAEGTLDCVASDHAPHLREEKEIELAYAPCGLIGLETTVGVMLTELVAKNKITLTRLIESLTVKPAEIVGLERGSLKDGMAGNVTIIDTDYKWTVDSSKFASKSANCPWNGQELVGKCIATIVSGRVVYKL